MFRRRERRPVSWRRRGYDVSRGNRVAGRATRPFRYRDKGSLATIGRARAVAELHGLRFSGFPAWALWLLIHIYYLIGFENRIRVVLRWAWYYAKLDRPVRIILRAEPSHPSMPSSTENPRP